MAHRLGIFAVVVACAAHLSAQDAIQPQHRFDLGPQLCTIIHAAATCNNFQLRAAGYDRFPLITNGYAAYTRFNYQLLPTVEVDFGAGRTWGRKSATYTGTVVNPIAGAALLANETTPLRYSNNNWFSGNTVLAFDQGRAGIRDVFERLKVGRV